MYCLLDLFMKFVIIILLLLGLKANAQRNYIADSSFENYTYLPTNYSSIYKDINTVLSTWFRPTGGTPDYFNTKCTSDSTSLPVYYIDSFSYHAACSNYQFPRSGDGVVRIGSYISSNLAYVFRGLNSYIQTQFTQPMKKDHNYFVSFYINKSTCSDMSVSNIGAYITNDAIRDYSSPYPPDTAWTNFKYFIIPQILNTKGPITDTVNWVKISGIYKAKGDEQWITIGHFPKQSEDYIFDLLPIYLSGVSYLIDDVSVYDFPSVIFPEKVCRNEVVNLSANLNGPFKWRDMSGNILSTDSIYTFNATVSTTYILESANNRMDTFSITVNELAPFCYPQIYVPNAFVPLGVNRAFKAVGNNIKELDMKIYNRWGELLFEGNGTNTEWNGYYKDFLCPAGIYIYLISYITYGSDDFKIEKGFVELIR
jgi:gliding motility-associated-like protein